MSEAALKKNLKSKNDTYTMKIKNFKLENISNFDVILLIIDYL